MTIDLVHCVLRLASWTSDWSADAIVVVVRYRVQCANSLAMAISIQPLGRLPQMIIMMNQLGSDWRIAMLLAIMRVLSSADAGSMYATRS